MGPPIPVDTARVFIDSARHGTCAQKGMTTWRLGSALGRKWMNTAHLIHWFTELSLPEGTLQQINIDPAMSWVFTRNMVIFWVYVIREESHICLLFVFSPMPRKSWKDLSASYWLWKYRFGSWAEIRWSPKVWHRCNIHDYTNPLQLLMHLQNSTSIVYIVIHVDLQIDVDIYI